jgi:hypothetical protein
MIIGKDAARVLSQKKERERDERDEIFYLLRKRHFFFQNHRGFLSTSTISFFRRVPPLGTASFAVESLSV